MNRQFWRGILERYRLWIYDYQHVLERLFLLSAVILALASLGLLLWDVGFLHIEEERLLIRLWSTRLVALFLVHYFLRMVTSLHPIKYLRTHRFEWLLSLLILLELGYWLATGRGWITTFLSPGGYMFLVHLAMISFIFIEVSRQLQQVAALPIKPAQLVVFSFLLLILMGTGLLMLPRATVQEGSMPFLDALFTATSAVCVTGLIVVDTATYFTHTGHWIILLLIQLGGIGVIAFATFLAASAGDQPGLRHLVVLQGVFDVASLLEARSLLIRVVAVTLSIEGVGALLLFNSWKESFSSLYERMFFSLFHAVSAFCNAGFSLFSNGLADPVHAFNPALNLIIIVLIVLGGLGFGVLWETFARFRLKQPIKKFSVHARIVWLMTGLLLLVGMIGFWILEIRPGGTLEGLGTMQQFLAALFQSVTTRTAGFNTVDIAQISLPVVVLFVVLMFIGASPGSTGGGVKTTTFAVIALYITTYFRGKQEVELFHRFLARRTLRKALVSFAFAVSFITLAIFLLTITEPFSLADIIFEEVSAFATVGLSRGITGSLTASGKGIIILSMFAGRVGMLTLAAALTRQVLSTRYRYPEVTIGIT